MNNFNAHDLNILDLPDEILLIIFEKVNTIDVFYSLVDVNRRLNRLALDPLYIRDVSMTIDSLDGRSISIDAEVLSRICQKILRRIAHQVHKLTVEQYLMKEALLATNYPRLYALSLSNVQLEVLHQYLTDDFVLRDLLTRQITDLNIDINTTTAVRSKTVVELFALVLFLCKRLNVLNIGDRFFTQKYGRPRFDVQLQNDISSSLIELKIYAQSVADCLGLLDGRLNSLSALFLNVKKIHDPVRDIGGREKLLKLKRFSLIGLSTRLNIMI